MLSLSKRMITHPSHRCSLGGAKLSLWSMARPDVVNCRKTRAFESRSTLRGNHLFPSTHTKFAASLGSPWPLYLGTWG